MKTINQFMDRRSWGKPGEISPVDQELLQEFPSEDMAAAVRAVLERDPNFIVANVQPPQDVHLYLAATKNILGRPRRKELVNVRGIADAVAGMFPDLQVESHITPDGGEAYIQIVLPVMEPVQAQSYGPPNLTLKKIHKWMIAKGWKGENREGQLVVIIQEAPVQDETMCGDEWLQLRKTPDGYTYAHEVRCQGVIVAVLVFRTDDEHQPILGRYERNPAHRDMSHPMVYTDIPFELSSITGGLEEHHRPPETAVMETAEEAGYTISEDQLMDLGTVRPSKGMDTTVYLFAVDVTGMEQGEITGDGSEGEEGAYAQWVSIEEAVNCKDPLLATMIARYFGSSQKSPT